MQLQLVWGRCGAGVAERPTAMGLPCQQLPATMMGLELTAASAGINPSRAANCLQLEAISGSQASVKHLQTATPSGFLTPPPKGTG